MPQPPEIFILAGPNGAGKTTAANLVLPKRFQVTEFVNADEIQQDLGPGASPMKAGRVMLRRMRELRDAGESFAFETTLAAKTYVPFLRDAQQAGYFVHLAFITLKTPELAKARVSDRVADGGHDIPPEDIERRFWRGLRNFFHLYQPLANTWSLCDNSGRSIVVIAHSRGTGQPMIHDKKRYLELRRAAEQAS